MIKARRPRVRQMLVRFTLVCNRCGHAAKLSFDVWEDALTAYRQAVCSSCGAKGLRAIGIHKVEFLSKAETERQRIER